MSPGDAGDGGFQGCLPPQVSAFLDAHRTCSRDEDCTIVGACSGPLFHAVRADAKAEAARLLANVRCGADGPEFNAKCERQRCVKRWNGAQCGSPGSERICQRTHELYSPGCGGTYGGDLCVRPCSASDTCAPGFSCQEKLFAAIEQCDGPPIPFRVCAPEPGCEVLLAIAHERYRATSVYRSGSFNTSKSLRLSATNLTRETTTFSYRHPCPGGPEVLGLATYDPYGKCLAGACPEMPLKTVVLAPGQRVELAAAKVQGPSDACNPSGLGRGEYLVRFALREVSGARVCGPEALELTVP